MFVIFSDSISNIIKIIEFRTGMDLTDERNQVSERFNELFNDKVRTSRTCLRFSVGDLSINPTLS